MGGERPKKFYRIALRVCPVLAIIFSILVTITTLYINAGISPPFIFISIQVYLNWYSICTISQSATTMRSSSREPKSNTVTITIDSHRSRFKYWYCEKCACHTYRPSQHCGACKKCFHLRDHHCFFIGGCILQQNMGNFILICFHTSLACSYTLTVLGPYLYENLRNIMDQDPSALNILLNFCFPVALARLTLAGDASCLLLVTFFDILFSVCLISFLYGAWKLFACLTGRQRYYPHIPRKQKLKEIFGSYGIYNFLFPYNGLIGSRDIDGKHELRRFRNFIMQ